jgi:hypothetical protein
MERKAANIGLEIECFHTCNEGIWNMDWQEDSRSAFSLERKKEEKKGIQTLTSNGIVLATISSIKGVKLSDGRETLEPHKPRCREMDVEVRGKKGRSGELRWVFIYPRGGAGRDCPGTCSGSCM